ncbi:MAG: hypothetical protein NTX86_02115 [Candidatus Dependentiae bacterium]|nr:hypothetical protein [Candidatus Dependentiae bacterium]
MKQVPVDKYNIAWFRLAEYVSRGEKERALGMYRLLSHSFDDLAFSCQLEGDILWAFNDSGAADKYCQAAQLYQEDKRILQAAAIYEHLIAVHPHSTLYLGCLVNLYTALQVEHKVLVPLCERLLFLLLADKQAPAERIMQHLHVTLDLLVESDGSTALQQCLARLEQTHSLYYQEACAYLNNK